VARAGLWSALAFVLNLVWEIAQVRLYTIWAAADGMSVAWALLHCTLGDVMIALVMFALAGAVLWRADWPASRPWTGGAIVVIGAMAFTAWSEWYNVYRVGNWGYTASMPTDFWHWSLPAIAVADPAARDGGCLSNAGFYAVRPAQHAKRDPNPRRHEDPAMTAEVNHSHQAHAHDHPHTGSTPPGAVAAASSRPLHLPDAPGDRA
jgi:hypothetical protein